MRGGPNAGWKRCGFRFVECDFHSLNEGWPECGMETVADNTGAKEIMWSE